MMITTASLPNVLGKPNLRYLAVKMPFSNLSRHNLLITTFKICIFLKGVRTLVCVHLPLVWLYATGQKQ